MSAAPLSLRQIVVRFRLAIYLYWALSSAFLGYYVLFFEQQKGITASRIGLMMSLYTLSAILGQYVLGYLCDRLQTLRRVVVAATLLLGIAVSTFPLHNHPALTYAAMALAGFFQQPLGPMLDTWLLKHLGRFAAESSYGKIRGLGSLGWSTGALLTAYLIDGLGWNMMFAVCGTAGALLIATALWIPDPVLSTDRAGERAGRPGSPGPAEAMAQLLRNPPYRYMLLVVFFLYLGVQTAYNFLGLIISGTGGGVIELGWTYFVDAGSEIPAMFLSVWLLRRYDPIRLMTAAIVVYIARFGIILAFQTAWVVAATSLLQGTAFGLMLTAFRNFVYRVAPQNLQTTAFALGDAVFLSLTVIIGGAFGGWIIETYSVMALMGLCMGLASVALILLLAGRKALNYQP